MQPDPNLINFLRSQPTIKLAILFGSISRGQETTTSDLDIALAADRPFSAQDKLNFIETLGQISGRPVDLIDLQVTHSPLLKQILTKGKLIYCLDRSLYAEIIKRMLFDEADIMPYRERILRERRQKWISS